MFVNIFLDSIFNIPTLLEYLDLYHTQTVCVYVCTKYYTNEEQASFIPCVVAICDAKKKK